METQELLQIAKTHLDITENGFDLKLFDLIEAAKLDLDLSGVEEVTDPEGDALYARAVVLYVSAFSGFRGKDSEGIALCYDSLKNHLALSFKYGEVLRHEAGNG